MATGVTHYDMTWIAGSSCGYSTEARQKRSSSRSKDQWSRQAPYDFTGCCAHADITYSISDSDVLRIIGYFEHNEGCRSATLVRYPSIPLHGHVYEVALEQLSQGARYVSLMGAAVVPARLMFSSAFLLSRLRTSGGLSIDSTVISTHVRITVIVRADLKPDHLVTKRCPLLPWNSGVAAGVLVGPD